MKELIEKLVTQMVEAGMFFPDAVTEFQRRYIRRVLEVNQGNQSQAAKALGIHRNTLGRKMEEYQLASRNGASRSKTRTAKSRRK